MRYPHVWLTADDAATAVWIPPGGTEMSEAQVDAIDSVLHHSLGARAEVVLQAFESFEAARPPDPHYYLTMLATSPSHARRGIGRRLLRSNLRRVDQEGEAAYLEARDELVPWYERFGFRVVRRFDLRDGPTVNTMWRSRTTDHFSSIGALTRRPIVEAPSPR